MYAAFGVASPFMPAFFQARGLAPEHLGILFGSGTAIRLISGPLCGRLADLLDRLLPADRVDRSRPRTDLAARYGFRGPTPSVRFRFLGDERWPPGLSELTGRIDELAAHAPAVSRVYVVENEMTYLAFPPVDDAVVVRRRRARGRRR